MKSYLDSAQERNKLSKNLIPEKDNIDLIKLELKKESRCQIAMLLRLKIDLLQNINYGFVSSFFR